MRLHRVVVFNNGQAYYYDGFCATLVVIAVRLIRLLRFALLFL